ncbi:uncharacterized protein LOC123904453 [Trifolium pratense]|uniref:uncharacterized protein LOC123904453 n=1 Tax=Trifolium pratense TaxID=57577 RepID=UPI001E69278A|nr:uncharacterized protein LOC123904453 [Trifolium pratense]
MERTGLLMRIYLNSCMHNRLINKADASVSVLQTLKAELHKYRQGPLGFQHTLFFVTLDLVGTRCGDKTTPISVSRKLKENVESIRSNDKGGIGDQVTLKDYNPIDPLPGVGPSNVNAGPIEHGTPLMPFIPKPPPLGHPNPDQGDYN